MTSAVKLDRLPAIRMEKETALREGKGSRGGGAVAVSDDDDDGDKTVPRPRPAPRRRRTVQNALVPSTPNSRKPARTSKREPSAALMLSILLHASPAEPGLLRPARPDGKPIAAYAERGEPRANQQGTVRGMHRRFSWDALNVTNDTSCGAEKCYFQGEREGEGWLVEQEARRKKDKQEKAKRSAVREHLAEWSKAWAFAEELRAEFGVGHLLRGPPFLATLTREQAKHLNARMHKVLGEDEPNPSPNGTLTLTLLA